MATTAQAPAGTENLRRALRSAQQACRRAAQELQRAQDADAFGVFVWQVGDTDGSRSRRELDEFLQLAEEEHEGQELTITVTARSAHRPRRRSV